jgi:Tfp pilus assembly protein PilV
MNKTALLIFAAIAAIIVFVGTLAVVPAQAQQFQNTQTNNQQACTRDCYNNQNAQGNAGANNVNQQGNAGGNNEQSIDSGQ